MAKATTSYALKGELDYNAGTITEITGKGENMEVNVYNLMAVLKEFDGRSISVSIKEDKNIPTVEELEIEEESEEDEE